MKSIAVMFAAVLTAAALSAGAASARPPAARAAHAPTVELRSTTLGKILVDSKGFTLYDFTRDSTGRDACQSIAGCMRAWPALTSSSRPTAGPGVRAALLSTIRLKSGARQVTYAGRPLYLYSADSEPGDTYYVGIEGSGGYWYAVSAAGRSIR